MRNLAAAALLAIVASGLIIFSLGCIASTVSDAFVHQPVNVRRTAAAIEILPPMKALTGDVIPRIACAMLPDKRKLPQISVGTGTWIAPNLVMTAAHVVEGTAACFANEEPAKLVRDYHALDIAFLAAANPSGVWAPISCDGIKPGEEYQTSGYADGDGYRRSAIWEALDGPVIDTGQNFDGMVRFEGLVRQGMSGAPIWQRDSGRIIAIVNAGNNDAPHDVWGRSLSDTYLCAGRA